MKKSQQKQTRSTNQSDKTSETDSTPCGVVYCDDNSGRNWTECPGCKTWYHNSCQDLDENESSAFLCDF